MFLRGNAVLVDADVAMTTVGLDIDDDLAVMWLLGASDVDIRSLTAVHGNSLGSLTCKGAHNLQAAIGQKRLPKIGCGGGWLTSFRAHSTEAVELLANATLASRRRVTWLALGPLTTIAATLYHRPEVAAKVDRLVFMGGSLGNGAAHTSLPSITAFLAGRAEFNLGSDAAAAQLVFETQIPKVIFPMENCAAVAFTLRDVDAIESCLTAQPKQKWLLQFTNRWRTHAAGAAKLNHRLFDLGPGSRGDEGAIPWDIVAASFVSRSDRAQLFGRPRRWPCYRVWMDGITMKSELAPHSGCYPHRRWQRWLWGASSRAVETETNETAFGYALAPSFLPRALAANRFGALLRKRLCLLDLEADKRT